ncbi:hypothetical protein DFH08DRAFT_745776, partial [Mycena albidolilacea]
MPPYRNSNMSSKDEPKDRFRTMKRPDPPHRNSSFSKRHASFDSPREIPLPSSSPNAMRAPPTASGEYPVFSDDSDWELIAPGSSKLRKDKSRPKPATPKLPLPPPSLSLSKSKSPLPSPLPSATAPPPLTPPASPPSPK